MRVGYARHGGDGREGIVAESLRDEISRIMDAPTEGDPMRLQAEVFGDPATVQPVAPVDMLRLDTLMIHGLREAVLRLAEEIEVLRTA